MTDPSSPLPSTKPSQELTLEDLRFIISVALESLKTAQNALSLIQDDQLTLPLSEWANMLMTSSESQKKD